MMASSLDDEVVVVGAEPSVSQNKRPRENGVTAGQQQPPPRRKQHSHQASNNSKSSKTKKKKIAARAKHRLWSIRRDSRTIPLESLSSREENDDSSSDDGDPHELVRHALPKKWKVVANERCGSWYVPPGAAGCDKTNTSSCYFKSTDGHVNTWEFSLKRLNLSLLELLTKDGGCFVVDSSVRKVLPDSFSRTIPIWATVLNRTVSRYSIHSASSTSPKPQPWDTSLHTPQGVVSPEEHATIEGLIDDRVETLLRSGAIVNPSQLTQTLIKPIRVVWMNHRGELYPSNNNNTSDDDGSGGKYESSLSLLAETYFVIVCWNPSRYVRKPTVPESSSSTMTTPLIQVHKHRNEWVDIRTNQTNNSTDGDSNDSGNGYFYTPGAADDHESWARQLTPSVFWKHQNALLNPDLDENGVDALIDQLVEQERNEEGNSLLECRTNGPSSEPSVYSYSNRIGDTTLWIGSRRAGRPPDCWKGFDAVLNVTNQEYDDDMDDTKSSSSSFYLQLPVEEGKRDRTQLERWMPVGLTFLVHHVQKNRRVLVHCAQGKDRSVAVALVFVILACHPLRFPLKPRPEFLSSDTSWDLSTLIEPTTTANEESSSSSSSTTPKLYFRSGLPNDVVTKLLGAGGKETFLLWIHEQLKSNRDTDGKLQCLADKESIRIALHLIRQDRNVAEPTRSTMQKINRFLMSSVLYR